MTAPHLAALPRRRLDGTLALGQRVPAAPTSIQHAALGTRADLDRRRRGGFFQGAGRRGADLERRPQRARRSPADRFDEITSGTGLIGRYGLNEGSGTRRRQLDRRHAPTAPPSPAPTWVAGFPRADLTPPAAPAGVSGARRATTSSRSTGRRTARPTSPATASTARRRRPVPTTGTPLTGASLLTAPELHRRDRASTARRTTTSSSRSTARATPRPPPATSSATPTAAAGSALQFNGTNHYVTFGAAPASARRRSRSRPGSGAPARAWAPRPAPAASRARSR